jgi:hypothetical protein
MNIPSQSKKPVLLARVDRQQPVVSDDVNYEMLVKQYQRGLRIKGNRSFQFKSLDFLFGKSP